MKLISRFLLFVIAGAMFWVPLIRADIVYVGDYFQGDIVTIDSTGNASVFAYPGGASAGLVADALALDSTGHLYAATLNNQIYKFDSQGNGSLFATTGMSDVRSIAFDSQGNLFAVNTGYHNIVKFDSGGTPSLFVSNTGVAAPFGGIAFDGSGNLYASIGGSTSIEKYNTSGQGSAFASLPSTAYSMAFHAGYLYVGTSDVSASEDHIYKIDLQGNVSLFANSGLRGPFGLAFDGSGNLFAINAFDNTITEFDSLGNSSLFASEQFGMNCIAIQVTPEPSAIAVFMISVAVISCWRRFAQRHSAS